MRRLALLAVIPCLAVADSWVKFRSGPFELLTDAGPRAGRETLVRFEQFRYALGQVIGVDDLASPEPIRIFVFKNAKEWGNAGLLANGRNCRGIALEEKTVLKPALYRALVALFIESNTARMPAAYERGLEAFFSTFESNGVRITVGAPPSPASAPPDLDWARIRLIAADSAFYGKSRVLFYNLRNGTPEDVAYRNAFGMTQAQVDAKAKEFLAAGRFETASLPGRAMSERDLSELAVSDSDARLARADLLAGAASAAEYQALIKANLKLAEADEGLGLLALREGRKDEALFRLNAAMDAGSSSARCYIEYAKLEPDNAKAQQALLKALGINSKLDEPFALLAARDADPGRRIEHWKAAAERNPRNVSYWKALADCYLADRNYAEAAKALTSGAQNATDPAERDRLRAARTAIEDRRVEYEAAEKKRKAEEEAREIARLKDEALARIHAAEDRINQGAPPPAAKPVPWWDGPTPSGKVAGALRQVDCLGARTRLLIDTDDRKTVRLLVTDASKVAINQPGQLALACGAQKPRRVTVEYFPKADAALATTGEVASIEFQ